MKFNTIKKAIRQTSLEAIMAMYDLTLKDISDELNIPYRSLQNWKYGASACPVYVIELISIYYSNKYLVLSLKEQNKSYENELKEIDLRLDKASDLLHDKRFSEAIEIIDNI